MKRTPFSFTSVYKEHFGNVSFSFSGMSAKAATRLPHAIPNCIHVSDDNLFDVGYIDIKTGELSTDIGEVVFNLFDTSLAAASEILSAIMRRTINLERLYADLDTRALCVLDENVDLSPFEVSTTNYRLYRLGPSSVEVTWRQGDAPKGFRPATIEFRGTSTWVVSDWVSCPKSRIILDPFGAVSKATARDIIIDVATS